MLLCVGFAYTGPLQIECVLRGDGTGLLPYIQEVDAPLEPLVDFLRAVPKDGNKPVVITPSVREFQRVVSEGLCVPKKRRPAVHGFVVCDDTVALQQVPGLSILDLAPGSPAQGWRFQAVQGRDLLRALKSKGITPVAKIGKRRSLDHYFTRPIMAKELIVRLKGALKSRVPDLDVQLVKAVLCHTKEPVWIALRKRLLSITEDNDSVMELDLFITTDTASALRSAHQEMGEKGRSLSKAAKKAECSEEDLAYLVSKVAPEKGLKYHPPKTRKGKTRDTTPEDVPDTESVLDAE